MGKVNVGGVYRFNRFSNPDVKYDNHATGFPDKANNAKTLNLNGPVVANFLNGSIGVIPLVCPGT